MIEIVPKIINDCEVSVPGSKSYTHRVLIAAALADGISTIHNALVSEDTILTRKALALMGVQIDDSGKDIFIKGWGGNLSLGSETIYLGNSGTSMRLLTAVAALGQGECTLTGTERMKERPLNDLVDALAKLDVKVTYLEKEGCPPIRIVGGSLVGGRTSICCRTSSQYLSGLLLAAPCTKEGMEISVSEGPVSKPYIDMTLNVMDRFGIEVMREGYDRFIVSGRQTYKSGMYAVEPDASQAGYFWAAAAITGGCVRVRGINRSSLQGDVHFTEVLEAMGCSVDATEDGIAVRGGKLKGITVDMADMPDLVPTLAVVAAFAKGSTVIKNVEHLRAKECDRLQAVVNELNRMGIVAESWDSGIKVEGGKPVGAEIETYDDHRIAMSFALAGLVVPGVMICGENCVAKSFPNFWDVFAGMA